MKQIIQMEDNNPSWKRKNQLAILKVMTMMMMMMMILLMMMITETFRLEDGQRVRDLI